jgi:hypothetical protein
LIAALFVLALFAPAATAQEDGNDDADDDGGAIPSASASASASASSSATAAADDDNGDDDRLPRTGGPALLAPIAGVLLIGGGVVGGIALGCSRDDS